MPARCLHNINIAQYACQKPSFLPLLLAIIVVFAYRCKNAQRSFLVAVMNSPAGPALFQVSLCARGNNATTCRFTLRIGGDMARKTVISESLLSIADISRHFALPESTTRYYCKRFSAFIPSVGEGRRRRYRPETLEVIAAILEQMQKSRTAAAVEDALLTRFPRNAVALAGNAPLQAVQSPAQDFFPSTALQLMERQTTALEGIAQLLHAVMERLPVQPRQDTHDTAGQNAALRQELDTLRLLLNASEKTQQADLEQLRQWMGRVIRNRGAADTQATKPAKQPPEPKKNASGFGQS